MKERNLKYSQGTQIGTTHPIPPLGDRGKLTPKL